MLGAEERKLPDVPGTRISAGIVAGYHLQRHLTGQAADDTAHLARRN
jgi:hypothetical protein